MPRKNQSAASTTVTLGENDAAGHRRMAMAGALAAIYPYAEGSEFKGQQEQRGFGVFTTKATKFQKGQLHTRGFFIYCCTAPMSQKEATVETAINFAKDVYRIDIPKYPFVLFGNNKENLLKKAKKYDGQLTDATITEIHNGSTKPTAATRNPVTPDKCEDWAAVLHEIKLAEIGDEAVRKLLNDEITKDMAAFLNDQNASKNTRKLLGIKNNISEGKTQQSNDTFNIAALKNIIDNAHQVATAVEVTVALDKDFSPRKDGSKSLTIVNGFMPRLGSGDSDGYDLGKYVSQKKLSEDGKKKLQAAYKESILTQMKAANAAGKKGLIIAPPNAFLSGLDPDNQKEAKKLWFAAAKGAATDNTSVTLHISDFDGQFAELCKSPATTTLTWTNNTTTTDGLTFVKGDAIDYATNNNLACAIGGHPTQPEGNGARSSAAATAFEENLYRRCTLGSLGAVRGGEPFVRPASSNRASSSTAAAAAAAASGGGGAPTANTTTTNNVTKILPFKNGNDQNPQSKLLQNTTTPKSATVSQKTINEASGWKSDNADENWKTINELTYGNAEAAYHAQKLIRYYQELGNLQSKQSNSSSSAAAAPSNDRIEFDNQKTLIIKMLQKIARVSKENTYFPNNATDPTSKTNNGTGQANYEQLIFDNIDTLAKNDNRIANGAQKKQGNDEKVKKSYAFADLTQSSPNTQKVKHNGREVPPAFIDMVAVQKARLAHSNNKNFRDYVLECATTGVFPVEISKYDITWASGKTDQGKFILGENLLGIAILEAANDILRAEEREIKIPDPFAAWAELQKAGAELGHDALEKSDGSKIDPPGLTRQRPPPPKRHDEEDQKEKTTSQLSWLKGLSASCTIATAFNLGEKTLQNALENFKKKLEESNHGFNLKITSGEIQEDNKNNITYKGEYGDKSFDASLTIESDQKNGTKITCTSRNLNYEKQLELIAVQAVTAQIAATGNKNVEVKEISKNNTFDKNSNDKTLMGKAGDKETPSSGKPLNASEFTFITACFKAGAQTVSYKGISYSKNDNKQALGAEESAKVSVAPQPDDEQEKSPSPT